MLSFGYTLLAHEAIAAAELAGLDPMVGFLHQHRWGRPALALDLMEEFRPITVDVAVWRCVSTRQVRPEQFEDDPSLGCRMGATPAMHSWPPMSVECSLSPRTSHLVGECPTGSHWACRPSY
jgi:CRISPR-associated endonuclease Cas1